MIYLAGEPDDIWWNGEVKEVYLGADLVWKSGPTIEVYDVSLDQVFGSGVFHPLISLAPPPGQAWDITIDGQFPNAPYSTAQRPSLVVGTSTSGPFGVGPASWSGQITAADNRVGVLTAGRSQFDWSSFVGTVTVAIP